VSVGPEHGLDRESVINCDNVFTVPKQLVGRRRGMLDHSAVVELRSALTLAFELDD
jgi:mRNA-degrading endonuclease toxin of MazEF toxin-antitoxin module